MDLYKEKTNRTCSIDQAKQYEWKEKPLWSTHVSYSIETELRISTDIRILKE